MAAHQRQVQLSGGADTTFTKIFVGGLAWETQRDTMRRYFEQFGEILEAVVITDKHTGRSKGYGFVTFKDPDSAMRACQDPTPVIDGRRANCNLAALGAAAHRPRAPNPHYVGRFRPAFVPAATSSPYYGSSSTTSAAFYHQPAQYAIPYSVYGYSSGGYSQEGVYPMGYYGVYSNQQHQQQQHHHHYQFSPYYSAGPGLYQNMYSYYPQYTQTGQAQSGFTLHYPQVLPYPYGQQHYASGAIPLPVSIATASAGVNTVAIVGPSSSQQPPGSTAAEPKSSA